MEIGETIEITSPEYPNYTDAAVCEWHLRPPTIASFTLEFLNFRLPSTDTRGRHSIEVLDYLLVTLFSLNFTVKYEVRVEQYFLYSLLTFVYFDYL